MKPIILAALFAAVSAIAPAATIFDNGAPDLVGANARSITIFRTADDFVLGTSATVDSVRFWMLAQPQEVYSGTLTYAFYQNSAGSLGAVVSTGTVNGIVPVFLSQVAQNIHAIYQVDFNLLAPLALGSGTYWLELHDGPSLTNAGSTQVLWQNLASIAGGNSKQNQNPQLPSNNVGGAQAFQLLGTVGSTSVPEPATMAATVIGLAALGLLRRRQA